MNMNKKLLAIALGATLFTGTAMAADTGSGTSEGTVATINTITLSVGDVTITTADQGGTSSLTGVDVISTTFTNNVIFGYDVKLKALNGKLLKSGETLGANEGAEIDYLFSCDDAVTEGSETITNLFDGTNMSTDTYQTMINVDNPAEATRDQTVTCDLSVNDDLNEKFAGDYADTLTITIISKSS